MVRVLIPGSGGFLNVIFAGFCLREEMFPLHLLRWVLTGVFPVPFDRRFCSFHVPLTLNLILRSLPFLVPGCSIFKLIYIIKDGCLFMYEDRSSFGLIEDSGFLFLETMVRLRLDLP
ncbi:hypothetical protein N665_3197s0004 [Sinapis alba]|nr:hypothetical protein N665_3197s0004 [Sinapis alba]